MLNSCQKPFSEEKNIQPKIKMLSSGVPGTVLALDHLFWLSGRLLKSQAHPATTPDTIMKKIFGEKWVG